MSTRIAAEWTWNGERFERDLAVVFEGASARIEPAENGCTRLPRRALLPAFVNAHSHSFQRVLRGRTEHRTRADRDTFWTWREKMYHAALSLTPDDLYDAARMCFLEMALAGIAWVGEFHYVHHQPDGTPYDDPLATARAIAAAADEVGIGIVLLQAGYERGGYNRDLHPAQRRFCTADPEVLCQRTAELGRTRRVGLAPHSLRAVTLDYARRLGAFAADHAWPLHFHASEQPGENSDVRAEHGATPVTVLQRAGLLGARTTLIHAVHLTPGEHALLGAARAGVCACPTTERNLGDGTVRADLLDTQGVSLALGTDSQIQIAPLEDARQLEYHLRLSLLERAALSPPTDQTPDGLARRLYAAATTGGARSLGLPAPESRADWIAVDLDDLSIAGAEDVSLLASLVFSLERTAITDVWAGGRQIVRDRAHAGSAGIVDRFRDLQRRLW